MLDQLLLVGLGGFFGALARYSVYKYFSNIKLFPLGTFLVNISGSFLMGLLLGSEWIPRNMTILWGTGFLGAYTTFSTFNVELFLLKKNNRFFIFLVYLTSSYSFAILAALLGFWIAAGAFF